MNYERFLEFIIEKGFFWPSFDIYRGRAETGGFYDYGPLGTLLKNNIINKWRSIFIYPYQDFIVEIETPIVMPRIVFEASGHLEHFTDYIVECLKCGRKYRADHLIEEELEKRGIRVRTEGLNENELYELITKYELKCPHCSGDLSNVRKFNLLFQTIIGPYSENIGYLRPETAQGMFVSFSRIYELQGRKIPLGIAQIGKVARNEISPRQGLVRLREFTQMEIELFFDPKNPKCPYIKDLEQVKLRIIPEDKVKKGALEPIELTVRELIEKGYVVNEWMAFFMALATIFLNELGVPLDKQAFIAKLPEERAHYATQAFDQIVKSERFGWIEVSGHAYRSDYDLSRHAQYSGQDLTVERKLEKPVEIEEVRVYPNPTKIKESYGNEASKVMKLLSQVNPKDLVREIEIRGEYLLGNYTIRRDMIFIKIEKRKLSTEKYIPHVVEPSFGVDRLVYVTLENAFTMINDKILLKLPPDLAPIKVAILPIVKKYEYTDIGKKIQKILSRSGFTTFYDDDGSIGSRYSKCDEIGIPYAITIDEKTLIDDTVTIRDRDTKRQIRVHIDHLVQILNELIYEKKGLKQIAESMNLQIIEYSHSS